MFIGRFQRTDYTDFEEQFLVCSGTLHISHQMIMRLELSLMNCFLNWTETDHNGQLVDSPKLDGKARGKPRQDGRGAFRIEHGQGQRAQVTAWSGGPDPTSSATITLPLSQRTSVAAGVLCDQLMEKECKKLNLVHECVVLICNCERKWTAVVLKPYSGVTLKSPISGNSLYKSSFKWCTLSSMWGKNIDKLMVNGEKLLSRVWLFATPWTVAYEALPPWDFPGKNTGVGFHFLLQEIFPTQGLNLGLPHCRLYRFTVWATREVSDKLTCNGKWLGWVRS